MRVRLACVLLVVLIGSPVFGQCSGPNCPPRVTAPPAFLRPPQAPPMRETVQSPPVYFAPVQPVYFAPVVVYRPAVFRPTFRLFR